MVGTTLEWYDFFLYGTAAAVVFPKVFFVKSDPLTATLLSFLTYALGFAARPIGGVVFGHVGDHGGLTADIACASGVLLLSCRETRRSRNARLLDQGEG